MARKHKTRPTATSTQPQQLYRSARQKHTSMKLVKRCASDDAAKAAKAANERREAEDISMTSERLELCKALYRYIHRGITDYADNPEQDKRYFRLMPEILEVLEGRCDDAEKAKLHQELLDGTFVGPDPKELFPDTGDPEELDDWDYYPDRNCYPAEEYGEMEDDEVIPPDGYLRYDLDLGCWVTGIPVLHS